MYCYSITVVCLFPPPLHPTPAEPPSLPYLYPHPSFCPCVLYSSSCNPLSSLYPPHSPLPVVRLFLTSMSLVIFCFLFSSIYCVLVKGEIIWYLSLTVWLISLNIYTMEFYAAERKKELIPFATAWMEQSIFQWHKISKLAFVCIWFRTLSSKCTHVFCIYQ